MIFWPDNEDWVEPLLSFTAALIGVAGLALLLYLFVTYWPELLR